MSPVRQAVSKTVYQLKITLREVRPPIWRRVQVLDNITLEKLHYTIQIAMGWTNSHLHSFTVDGVSYGEPDPELEFKSERRARLNEVVTEEKAKFRYEYDFGDSWEHEILVEKIQPAEPGKTYPVCITGKRACPPEDCGGAWGYADLLEAIQDPAHPEHEELTSWLEDVWGIEAFDPEAFDSEEVNRELKRLR